MTIEELTTQTAYAVQFESMYEGYRWDIEPIDVWKLLEERQTYHEAINMILSKCKSSGDIGLLCLKAKQKTEELWPAPTIEQKATRA